MALKLTANEVERVHIPAGIKDARLVSLREQQFPDFDDPTKMKDHIIWAFEISRKGGAVTIEGITSTAFGGKSNARRWAKALLAGAEPPNTFDLEELIDQPCKVKVDDKEKDGQKYSRVTDVFTAVDEDEDEEAAPAPKPAAKPPAARTARPAAPDDDEIEF